MIKLGTLLLIACLCNGQKNNSSTKNSNEQRNENGTYLFSQKFDWRSIITEKFGTNFSTNSTVLVTEEGLTKLMIRLGLNKPTNQTKEIVAGKIIKCDSSKEIIRLYKGGLTEEEFLDVCPSLLLQIESRVCRQGFKKGSMDKSPPIVKHYLKIWLFSSGAVLICSMVGLIVVWLIPILPKSYYNSISQLLIALAVGSLTGDALLHLIPHALMDDGSGDHSHGTGSEKGHSQMVWKALAAFFGIHIFFLTERITILCQNLKSKRKFKNKQLSFDNIYQEVPSGDGFDEAEKMAVTFSDIKSLSMGKLHWASKSRKYSSSSREMEHASSNTGLNTEANIGAHLCNQPKSKPHVNSDCPDSMNINLCHTINPYSMTEETSDNPRSSSTLPVNGDVKSYNNNMQTTEVKTPEKVTTNVSSNHSHNDFPCATHKDNSWSNNEEYKLGDHSHFDPNGNNHETKTIVSKQTESIGELGAGGATVMSSLAHPYHNKPHGHHHGHSHDLSSVKAIAYTVIVGDGLHNFCDGIAIGAAFANDIRGGLSTAIAVLCHELPHELGDFVVLLHAGMSLKTAIFYNLMSSVFCAAGMVIGVLLGRVPLVSSWIFMITAGMFLYIALVDMMPELSTRRLQGNKLFHRPSILFLWQNIGLILGAVIMLLIALYEEDMF